MTDKYKTLSKSLQRTLRIDSKSKNRTIEPENMILSKVKLNSESNKNKQKIEQLESHKQNNEVD